MDQARNEAENKLVSKLAEKVKKDSSKLKHFSTNQYAMHKIIYCAMQAEAFKGCVLGDDEVQPFCFSVV